VVSDRSERLPFSVEPGAADRPPWPPAWLRYLQSVLLVLLALVISVPVHFSIEPVNLVMLFLAAVLLAAVFLGRGPAILASVLSVLAFDFFLIEPRLSLSVEDSQYLLTFFGLLAVGLVISTTVARLRTQVEATRQREAHAEALNSLSRDLTGQVSLDEMLRSVVRHIHASFAGRVVILLPGDGGLRLAADSAENGSLDPADLEAAGRVFRQEAETAGTPAKVLAEGEQASRLYYLPLRTSLGAVGVLGIDPGPRYALLLDEPRRSLLRGFANLAALAIERARLAEQAAQAEVLQNIERLQAALLNSISHELRTPLVSITGALSTLAELPEDSSEPAAGEQAARRELVETAYDEARRLNRLVGNLLDMSRLESGALRLNLEPCDLQDLMGITLERFGERRRDCTVRTSLPDDLPLIDLDVALMAQALVNLLDNAAKYSPPGAAIDLACRRADGWIEIEVADRGPGIADADLERIFDKFYRSPRMRSISGLGLGLSISKGIVEAHGGTIQARSRPGGGLSMLVKLPISGEISKP
jgi:two-component system sensor histidine kinase KdpD